jgi:hypothetical protein
MPQWLTKLVGDPGWWFTVVLAALVVNVASAFASRRVSNVLARLSKRYRHRRQTRDAEEDAVAEMLSRDTALIVIKTVILGIIITLLCTLELTGLIAMTFGAVKGRYGWFMVYIGFGACMGGLLFIPVLGKIFRTLRLAIDKYKVSFRETSNKTDSK